VRDNGRVGNSVEDKYASAEIVSWFETLDTHLPRVVSTLDSALNRP
jgi:hypothetical protein